MQISEIERAYPDVVVVAVRYLLDICNSKDEIGQREIERAIRAVTIMNEDVMDAERISWMEKDLPFLMENYWDVLKDKKNRGQRDQIIRGALTLR